MKTSVRSRRILETKIAILQNERKDISGKSHRRASKTPKKNYQNHTRVTI
jgi:hypothetical protein